MGCREFNRCECHREQTVHSFENCAVVARDRIPGAAFNRIELFVVIAIIAILMAMKW